jgi:hypothetical protein
MHMSGPVGASLYPHEAHAGKHSHPSMASPPYSEKHCGAAERQFSQIQVKSPAFECTVTTRTFSPQQETPQTSGWIFELKGEPLARETASKNDV